MKRNLSFLFSLCFLLACQPELPLPQADLQTASCSWDSLKGSILLPVSDSCRSEPWPLAPPIGYDFRMPDTTYLLLGANPEQLQQFMYTLRINTFPPRSEIWLVDLCTGLNLQVMADARPMSAARWSAQNWIVFEENHQLWKITTQGDSLTQLTNSASNSYADWSPDGEHMYYRRQLTSRGAEARYAIMDKHGQFVSQFDSLFPYPNIIWSQDKSRGVLQTTLGTDTSRIIQLSPQAVVPFFLPNEIATNSGINGWLSEEEIYLNQLHGGVYFYHLGTGQYEGYFEQVCFNNRIQGVVISSDRKYGIATRLNRSLYDPITFWDDSRLYWLDFENEEMWEMKL